MITDWGKGVISWPRVYIFVYLNPIRTILKVQVCSYTQTCIVHLKLYSLCTWNCTHCAPEIVLIVHLKLYPLCTWNCTHCASPLCTWNCTHCASPLCTWNCTHLYVSKWTCLIFLTWTCIAVSPLYYFLSLSVSLSLSLSLSLSFCCYPCTCPSVKEGTLGYSRVESYRVR